MTVANGLARPRDGMVRVTVPVRRDGIRWLEVRDEGGALVPSVTEGFQRQPDGSLAEVSLTFLATAVPALGRRIYRLRATPTPPASRGKPPGR